MARRLVERERLHFERALDQLLDIGELLALVRAAQRQRVARRTRTAGTADPVHVVFRAERQVEVDHGRQFGDVEAARGHVGRDQRLDLAALERVECLHPLDLRLVAVDRRRDHAIALEIARKPACADLAVAEHDHLLEAAIAQQLHDGRLLVAFGDVVDDLRDVRVRRVAARDFDRLRVAQVGRRELLDFAREGGREQQRLALLRQQVQDALQIRQEAHVEHPVGFVEHEDLHLAEIRRLLLHVVEQAARRRDDDVDTALERIDLRIDADAAEHHGRAQLHVLAVRTDAFLDLGGEFASRREDQRAHGALRAAMFRVERMQALQDRQREAGGLAGARLRAGEQVAATEDGRDRLLLDRGRRRVAEFVDRLDQRFGQAERFERHRYHSSVL